jgi:hypothetical protein
MKGFWMPQNGSATESGLNINLIELPDRDSSICQLVERNGNSTNEHTRSTHGLLGGTDEQRAHRDSDDGHDDVLNTSANMFSW